MFQRCSRGLPEVFQISAGCLPEVFQRCSRDQSAFPFRIRAPITPHRGWPSALGVGGLIDPWGVSLWVQEPKVALGTLKGRAHRLGIPNSGLVDGTTSLDFWRPRGPLHRARETSLCTQEYFLVFALRICFTQTCVPNSELVDGTKS